MRNFTLCLLFSLLAVCSFAEVHLPAIIADNMVLQRQSLVALWGWSNPSEKIIVTTLWNNKTESVNATRDAKWKIMVQSPVTGGPYTITIKGGR